jgi:uncharacterized membrane protein (DUF373 family)
METINAVRRQFFFTPEDQDNLAKLGEIILPASDQLADDFYEYLTQNPETASYFKTDQAKAHRKVTFKQWLDDLFNANYDNRYLQRLQRIGKVHVKIKLKSIYVNAAMHFVREACRRIVSAEVRDGAVQEELLATLHKALDLNLSVMTSSYQEEKFNKFFLSHALESKVILFSKRLLHGMNLVLMICLLLMAGAVVGLLGFDLVEAVTGKLEYGIIKALGSLLLLWMMIELLHNEIAHLQGDKFRVRIFIELALVAFIRKIFVASFKYEDPMTFVLMLLGLLILGIVYYLVAKREDITGS